MPTISDLIHSSFRLIGAIAAGETLETNELNDAFISFNQMIALWNTEGLSVVGRGRQLIPLAINNGGPYILPFRPVKIESASTAMGANVPAEIIDNPLEIVDSTGWEAIDEKGTVANRTRKLFCDYIYPQSSVYIWPVPRSVATLEIWVYVGLPQFSTLTDVVDLAPGYEQALRYNFAIALLPEYPRSQVDPSLPAQAQAYKASLMQLNASNHARTAQPTLVTQAAQGTS